MDTHHYRLIVVLTAASMLLSLIGLTVAPGPAIHPGNEVLRQLQPGR